MLKSTGYLVLWALFPVLISLGSLNESTLAQPTDAITGKWKCHIECPGGEIRFGITVESMDERYKYKAFVTNGSEKIEIPLVFIKRAFEDVTFVFDHYDSKIQFGVKGNQLTGKWTKFRGADKIVKMKFFGQRVIGNQETPQIDQQRNAVDGRWLVNFNKSEDPAVGIFKSNDDGTLGGTFLTTTGDYRFLDGRQTGDAIELSCFDGAHAFLFKAQLNDAGILEGDFWSSNTWHEKWTASRDKDAKLPDAFKQTVLVKKNLVSEFKFPDLTGKPTSLVDPKFSAPARMIYVFGSWCPNCHDAAVYFKQLQKKYGDDLSILGLAFELTGEFERDSRQVKKYLERHGVDYPVLIAGVSDKKLATDSIPFLDRVRSYPTTLFLNSDNEIVAIHTGFTGPATGAAYDELKMRFEEIIYDLIGKK